MALGAARVVDMSGTDRRAPYLMLIEGGIPGMLLPLKLGGNTIGRSMESEIQLLERTVSRRHALLEVWDDQPTRLTDLNSVNGTFVNGERLPQGMPTSLAEGSKIRFGTLVVTQFLMLTKAQEQRRRDLFDRSIRDPLTELPTLAYFLDQVGRKAEANRKANLGLAIALLDIDHLESINQRYGRDAGDATLAELAGLLRSGTRHDDLIARIDGNTFAVAATAPDFPVAHAWAERLREMTARRLIRTERAMFWITVSVGLGFSPPGQCNPSFALSTAELCLSRAKVAGRNCVVSNPEPILGV
ncbi:diguanylate cyclase [Isosphaera pallida ATCC 43644]|uniref:diguanylate cyclase n=2 Tax=Isosphaera pallida TaxID=128 RepID=E8QXS0_ISOPI|nr:diguanylate cyclase [Isosphaera pallida ATCC 43644]